MKSTAFAILSFILVTGILPAQAVKKPKEFCRGKNGLKYQVYDGYKEGCTQFICVKKGKKLKMTSEPIPNCGPEKNVNVTALQMNVDSLTARVDSLLSLVTKQGTCMSDFTSSECPVPSPGKISLVDQISSNKEDIHVNKAGINNNKDEVSSYKEGIVSNTATYSSIQDTTTNIDTCYDTGCKNAFYGLGMCVDTSSVDWEEASKIIDFSAGTKDGECSKDCNCNCFKRTGCYSQKCDANDGICLIPVQEQRKGFFIPPEYKKAFACDESLDCFCYIKNYEGVTEQQSSSTETTTTTMTTTTTTTTKAQTGSSTETTPTTMTTTTTTKAQTVLWIAGTNDKTIETLKLPDFTPVNASCKVPNPNMDLLDSDIQEIQGKLYSCDHRLCQTYSAEDNTWTTIPGKRFKFQRTNPAGTVIGDKWIVQGGWVNENGKQIDVTAEVWSPATGNWVEAPQYKSPLPVHAHCVVNINGKIMQIGGYSSVLNTYTGKCFVDGGEVASLKAPRSFHSCNVFHGEVWVAGGYRKGNDARVVEIYNPQSKSWAEGAKLPGEIKADYNPLLVTYEGNLYYVGGREISKIYKLNIDQYKWEEVGDIAKERKWGHIVNTKIC